MFHLLVHGCILRWIASLTSLLEVYVMSSVSVLLVSHRLGLNDAAT